ncbi:hypothetical protein VTK73DRAFT_9384 [Phialemonium thermophilum]|uniref:Uncharacterized protein n=1 Tax=Phialemonium thermophilum TaxID=223376 RepID=A0ABR3W2M4_9PEZI
MTLCHDRLRMPAGWPVAWPISRDHEGGTDPGRPWCIIPLTTTRGILCPWPSLVQPYGTFRSVMYIDPGHDPVVCPPCWLVGWFGFVRLVCRCSSSPFSQGNSADAAAHRSDLAPRYVHSPTPLPFLTSCDTGTVSHHDWAATRLSSPPWRQLGSPTLPFAPAIAESASAVSHRPETPLSPAPFQTDTSVVVPNKKQNSVSLKGPDSSSPVTGRAHATSRPRSDTSSRYV